MTGADKGHASVGFFMLRWYKCAEFCILKGQNCVAWFGHRCSGNHERNYGLGMDALVIALTGTRTELWFGHGCSGEPMLVTRGLIRVLEVYVSILGEMWGRKAKPCTL